MKESTRRSRVLRRSAALLLVLGATATAFPAIVGADDVSNNIDGSIDVAIEQMSLVAGGASGSTTLYIQPRNGDGNNGCNIQGGEALTLRVFSSDPGVATVSPLSITFGSCADTGLITVTPLATGATTVSVSEISNNTGGTFNLLPATFTVNVSAPVVTNNTPVVTISSPANGATIEGNTLGGANVTVTASVSDEDTLTATCSPAGPLFAVGAHTVTCSATDSKGATGTATRSFSVVDTTDPVISVPATITKEATGPAGAVATFTASATDIVSGAVTATCVPASGSTFALRTNTVTCTATDAAGNTASEDFSVIVEDTTAPSITVPGDITEEATGPSGAVVTFSASASDIVDGAVVPTCVPASGSTFALGDTQVTCTATDAAGNDASDSFTVTVEDTTAPSITVPGDITEEATGPSGAVVTFSASASDIVDGAVVPTCVPASGSTFALGDTQVTCTATDAAGNDASDSFTVTVEDTTAPSITVPADITVDPTGITGAVVNYSGQSATDLVDGSITPTCVKASGSLFGFGTTTVTCSATDAAGNTGSETFTVTVNNLRRSGFYQPVDMQGVLNIVKAGSTVPMKFEVFAGTTEVKTTAVVKSFTTKLVPCSTLTSTADDIEVVTTGGTTLRFDTTGDQFIQNWQTPKAAGTCYVVTMTSTDNQTLSANFKLK